jgi:hypothetical protein
LDTNRKIIKTKQKINKSKLQYARTKEKERKFDVHRKIQLGGLVIKAKIDNESKSIILGALIHAMEEINSDNKMKNFYKAKGDAAFMGHLEK